MKDVVDRDRSPGQFVLNGSADFLTVPSFSESLAGRAAMLDLWPFTQGEIDDCPDGFVRRVFDDPESLRSQALDIGGEKLTTADYLELVCRGGFPEVVALPERQRGMWFRNYVRAITQRDITELTGARRATSLPRLLSLIAARSGQELVVSRLHADSDISSRQTVEDYIGHLHMTYLVLTIPAWPRNLTNRMSRHGKVHLVDTGLAAHLLGKTAASLERPTDPARGPLMESFVVNELLRQVSWADPSIVVSHLRERGAVEVDVVLETGDGRVVGIEVKASASVNAVDAKGLAWMRDKVGGDFVHGFVLYAGTRPFVLGDRLTAVPISHLWRTPQ